MLLFAHVVISLQLSLICLVSITQLTVSLRIRPRRLLFLVPILLHKRINLLLALYHLF